MAEGDSTENMNALEIINGDFRTHMRQLLSSEMQRKFEVEFINFAEFLECGWKDEIRLNYMLDGHQTGWGSVKVERSSLDGKIIWDRFYPHESKRCLERIGVGTLAQVSTIIQLCEQVEEITGEYRVIHNPFSTSEEYAHLLSSIGIGYQDRIDSYLDKCVSYAARKGFIFENPFTKS